MCCAGAGGHSLRTGLRIMLRIVMGWILLIVPGIVMTIRYLLWAPVVLMEGLTGKAALKRARELASRSWFTIIVVCLIQFMVPTIVNLIMARLIGVSRGVKPSPGIKITAQTSSLMTIFVLPLMSIVPALLYLKMRQLGGETLNDVMAQIEEVEGARSNWRQRMRTRLTVKRRRRDTDLVVFHGYPQIGVPQSAAAMISESGLSDVHDITFTRIGGELSPNGRFIAYDNCSSPNRGIYLVEPDGSKAQMVKDLNGNRCVDIRWSPDSAKFSYTNPQDRSLHIFDIASKSDSLIPNIRDADWHWWSPTGNGSSMDGGLAESQSMVRPVVCCISLT